MARGFWQVTLTPGQVIRNRWERRCSFLHLGHREGSLNFARSLKRKPQPSQVGGWIWRRACRFDRLSARPEPPERVEGRRACPEPSRRDGRRRERAMCSRSSMMTFLETTKFLASSSSVHSRSPSIAVISCRLVSSIALSLRTSRRRASGHWLSLRRRAQTWPVAMTRGGTRTTTRWPGGPGGRRNRSR